MVSLTLDDPKGVERRLRALVQPILEPDWLEDVSGPQTIEDHERAADVLDLLIDVLEDSGIGVLRDLVPADEIVEWFTPRKLTAQANGTAFELVVNPEGGLNIRIFVGRTCFTHHGLTAEAIATLIRSFSGLQMADPDQ